MMFVNSGKGPPRKASLPTEFSTTVTTFLAKNKKWIAQISSQVAVTSLHVCGGIITNAGSTVAIPIQ